MATSIAVNRVQYVSKKSGLIVSSVGQVDAVIDEHHFVRMLRVERKRTERSGKPFMLVLLHQDSSSKAGNVLNLAAAALASVVRETDSLGWYETGSVLGVMFTEFGAAETSVIEIIREKVAASLRETLDVADASQISLTYHVYPEEKGNPTKGVADTHLYPDLPRIASRKKAAIASKRVIDVAGSLFALVVLSPVFLVLSAIIKLTSPGPVLFRQKRIGQHGKPFTFLKFRSMHANNDAKIHQEYVKSLIAGKAGVQSDGKNVAFKLTNDPRVTPIGRFIRRTSLDELPQFFNVLSGKMSLVGPRPPVPYEYQEYDVWHRDRMMEVKPGITGLWQVTGRSRTTFDEMVRLDLRYAGSWSIPMDLKILLQTPVAVLSGDGAY